MGDTTNEVLLFEVKLDAKKTAQEAEELRAIIARLRTEKRALDKDYKDGTISAQEFAKSSQAIETNLSRATTQLKAHTKALDLDDKQQKSAQGSIDQMRARLISLNTAYDALDETERDNQKTGVAVQKTIDDLTTKLKQLEDGTGRNQRNVGNYSDAFKTNTKSIKDNQLTVTDYIKKVDVMGINIGEVVDKFKSGTDTAGGFTKAVFSGRGALVALTAVPIIFLLTSIIAFLTKSKDGMEFLARKTAAVTAVFDYFSKIVSGIGRAIAKAFEQGNVIEKLGDIIKENLTNRLNAFKVILDAVRNTDLRALGDGLVQLFTGITNASGKIDDIATAAGRAAQQAEELTRQSQKVADAERALNVERAKSRAEIEKQKFLSEDVSKSQSERETAARNAFAIENNLLNKQISLQQQKISIAKQQAALSNGDAEDLQKIADAETELGELREESFGKQTELNNKINELRIAGAQQALAIELAEANKRLQIARENGNATFDIQKEILDKQLAYDLAAVNKGSDQEKALRLKYDVELAQLRLSTLNEEQDQLDRIQLAAVEARLLEVRKGSKEEIALQKEKLTLIAGLEDSARIQSIRGEEEHAAELKKATAQLNKDLAALDKQYRDTQRSEAKAGVDKRLSESKVGSRAELDARQADLILQQQAELDNEDLTERQRAAIKAKYRRAEQDLQKAYSDQVKTEILDSVANSSAALSKLFDAQTASQTNALQKAQDAQLNSAGLSASQREKIEENFAKKKEKLDKDAAERRKVIATVENIIAIARGETEAFKLPPPFNVIQAALVAANGLAQQAVISSQQFALGGVPFVTDKRGNIVSGPGTATSDSIPARLSNGESVVNARSTSMFYDVLSHLNQLGGGRAFPGAKAPHSFTPTLNLAAGGVANIQQTGSATINTDAIAALITKGVAEAVANIPAPQVAVTDIRSKTAEVVYVETRASK